VRSVDVVVAHCAHSLVWLDGYLERVAELSGNAAVRVTIYSKCGRRVVGHESTRWAQVITLPNRGRNDHTYAYHIQSQYDSLADLTLFVKDTLDPTDPQDRGFDIVDDVANVYRVAASLGFACHYTPLYDSIASVFTPWSAMRDFVMETYKGEYSRAPLHHRPLQNWLTAMIKGTGTPPPSSLWPVCYGGNFAALRANIHAVSQQVWMNLNESLSRGESIEEGHYAERAWAGLLTSRLPEEDAALLRSHSRVQDPERCDGDFRLWWHYHTGCEVVDDEEPHESATNGKAPLLHCRCAS